MYKRERPSYAPRRKTPSFSSSLLEAVYRSIDEPEGQDLRSAFYDKGFADAMRKQSSSRDYDRNAASAPSPAGRRRLLSLDRVAMIEDWMEKHGQGGRGSISLRLNLSSRSSGSSLGGRRGPSSFSSYETESGRRKHLSEQKSWVASCEDRKKTKKKDMNEDLGSGFSRTKLGVLKIYRELQKAKQPMSPGAKISAFLNSLFHSGNIKKPKMCYVGAVNDVSSFDHKVALSFMSTSPSTRNLSTTNSSNKPPKTKRTVKHYPSRSISDNNSNPYGYQTTWRSSTSYKEKHFAATTNNGGNKLDVNEGSKASSCSSSDLFELDDHLIRRYVEESPLCDSTAEITWNQAIAHGYFTM